MKSNFLLTILVVIVLTSVSGFTGYYILTNIYQEKTFNVSRVIDGDTIEIESGEKIRLLGINAPEENERYFKEAKDKLSQLVNYKNVRLESGSEDKDDFGRLLRYVYIGNILVNLELVKEGYAKVHIINTEEKYYFEFNKAQKEARESKLGLWTTSNITCIVIITFNYDAKGNDNENLNDEYVTFKNNCEYPVNLKGWGIEDNSARNRYTFKVFVFQPNNSFTLFSGKGVDGPNDLYWNSKSAIWNNGGDTLLLRDDKGNLVLSYIYP